jgi:ribonuclease P protein component
MSDAASGATASVSACGHGPDAPSSRLVVARAAAASPRRAAPYTSLRRSSDIGMVRRIGIRRRVGGITTFVATGEPGLPRVAFVAGRAAGSAVRRNRAKRRMREAVRRAPLREGYDYVVTADGSVSEAPFATVVAWVQAALAEE